jgi:intracellular sulfur oxidation DsrE/DsrF family protein
MKSVTRVIVLTIFAIIFSVNLQAQVMKHNADNYKVVFQLSNDDTLVHKGFVKQLNNLAAAMDNVDIEVVVHGPGADFLKNDSKFKLDIEHFAASGVTFLLCRNTLKERKINETELLPQVKIIPAAIVHIIKRQAENWSYIKVGF